MRSARMVLALGMVVSFGILCLPIRAADSKTYTEDFEEPGTPLEPGTPEDFVVYRPDGVIEDGWLVLRATGGGEPFAWAGTEGIATAFDKIESISFTIEFVGVPGDAVGRHGGAFVCAKEATSRAGAASGYLVDWIDRPADRGYRVHKYTNGGLTNLGIFPSPTDEPGAEWRIEFDDDGFTLTVDGEEIGRADDFAGPFRNGYVGFWAYTNSVAGQEIMFDDVEVVYTPATCPRISPADATALAGDTVTFTISIPTGANANDAYVVTVTSSDPDVAVPAGAVGGTADIEFPAAGPQSLTVDVEALGAGEAEICVSGKGADCPCEGETLATVVVTDVVPHFCDDFADDDEGMPPLEWTVLGGMWTVMEERLDILATGGEAWIVAGNPAVPIAAVETIKLNIELSNDVDFNVGKHGGIQFFAQGAVNRWSTSGYTIDWIDRAADQGYRFIRWDNGGVNFIGQTPAGLYPEPAYEWRVESDDEWLWFYADDELVFEVQDGTYRGGYFALWAYGNSTHMVVDDVCVGTDCCGIRPGQPFVRGSADGDVALTLGDAITTLNYLFASGATPPCLKAADCDDSGDLTLGDPIIFLNFMFAGGRAPAPPIPGCGPDPTDDTLTCESFPGCPK